MIRNILNRNLSIFLLWGFIISLASSILCAQNVKFKWKEVPSLAPESYSFLIGKSQSDFWISCWNGKLLHWDGKKWDSYFPPVQKPSILVQYIALSDQVFLAAAADKEYHTQYFIFENGAWKKQPLKVQSRTQNFLHCSDGSVYVYGDWGTLLRYRKGLWQRISTPFKNHIIIMRETAPGEFWLAVRSEGIFQYKDSFQCILMPDNLAAGVTDLKFFQGSLYALSSHFRSLIYQDNQFVPIDLPYSSFWETYKEGGLGFTRIEMRNSKDEPLAFEFPKHYRVINHGLIADSIAILLTSNGRIYAGYPSSIGNFVDCTNAYNVTANPDYQPSGATFIDINNDGRDDLFLFYPQSRGLSKFFINELHQPFGTNASLLHTVRMDGALLYTLSDINQDGRPDLIIARTDTTGLILDIYEQQKDITYHYSRSLEGPELQSGQKLTHITTVDIDNDGDLDIALTYYFNPSMQAGNMVVLRNSLWGNSFTVDTSLVGITGGWNIQSIFADLDNDSHPEWIIVDRWRKISFLKKINEKWNVLDSAITNSFVDVPLIGITLADFDIDGDLDIVGLTISEGIQYYQNDGKMHFTRTSSSMFPKGQVPPFEILSRLSVGDINNDGFPDILIGNKTGNHLLINQGGKLFQDLTDDYGLASSMSVEIVLTDIDNDGDLDLFGYGDESNALWINTQNDSNYLEIILQGVVSNSEGKNASIWIYESGHLSEPAFLCGYQQSGVNQNTSRVVHFGVSSAKTYDIRIQFQAGRERILKNVRTGQILIVKEVEGVIAGIHQIPGIAFRFLKDPEVHWYAFFTCCALIFLGVGARYGVEKFEWGARSLFVFVTINLLLYWGISALTSSSGFVVKYFTPLSMMFLGVTLPNVIYYWARSRHQNGKIEEELQYELLQAVVEFMHGEWAMRSLNSLILYCNDMAAMERIEPTMRQQFQERRTTFIEMTQPRLKKICNLAKQIRFEDIIAAELDRQLKQVVDILMSSDLPSKETLLSAGVSLQSLKNALISYRDNVLLSHSCNPFEVVERVIAALHSEEERTPLHIVKLTAFTDRCRVLIHNYELADIFDNNIRNARRAIDQNKNGKIEVILYRSSPKICIDVIDNGTGIAKEKVEKVFDRGYSEHGGTGLGLAMSRTILQKYGGRIFIKRSELGAGTIFTIELNEVPLT